MMNGQILYDEPFHPFNQHLALDGKRPIYRKYARSQRPIRYYYIDFGYAKWFHSTDEPRLIRGSRAREPTPEQLAGNLYDPFKADIYQLGAIIRRDLIKVGIFFDYVLHFDDMRYSLAICTSCIPLAAGAGNDRPRPGQAA